MEAISDDRTANVFDNRQARKHSETIHTHHSQELKELLEQEINKI